MIWRPEWPGTVRHVPPPLELRDMDHDELILLAHLLGNGAVTTDTDIEYRSASASKPVGGERGGSASVRSGGRAR